MDALFQSTRLLEARRCIHSEGATTITGFNPRACSRRDSICRAFADASSGFNPRACSRRDAAARTNGFILQEFQSTRLLEARRAARERRAAYRVVSIHAPARGATFNRHSFCARCAVSIHAPARGATLWGTLIPNLALFQSTRLLEARHDGFSVIAFSRAFQSTRLLEARRGVTTEPFTVIVFQSTRLLEARRSISDTEQVL